MGWRWTALDRFVAGGRAGRRGTACSLVLAALLILLGGATWLDGQPVRLVPERRPRLVMDGSVAGDLAALAGETWAQFLDVLEARAGCFGDVRLRASRTLGDRAAYDPDTATVTVRVPGSKALLQSALVHEWAHHVEFQCEAQQELRAGFLAAQGLLPDAQWRPDVAPADIPASLWAKIPSEQYAEALGALVLGSGQVPSVAPVKGEAVRVLAEWAAGGSP